MNDTEQGVPMDDPRLPAVFACPDGRIAVQVNFDGQTWLMIDGTGVMGVARGELTDKAVPMRTDPHT